MGQKAQSSWEEWIISRTVRWAQRQRLLRGRKLGVDGLLRTASKVCLFSLLLPLGGAQHSRIITVTRTLRFGAAFPPNRRATADPGFLHLCPDLRSDLGVGHREYRDWDWGAGSQISKYTDASQAFEDSQSVETSGDILGSLGPTGLKVIGWSNYGSEKPSWAQERWWYFTPGAKEFMVIRNEQDWEIGCRPGME